MAIDLLIKEGVLITMDGERRVIEGGDIAVDGGKIVGIGKGM